jgi:Icc-related predicted phosphoesterase
MKITALSDMHGELPELEGGDLLIIAGDCTSNDSVRAWKVFYEWFEKMSKLYRKSILVAGNHDNFLKNIACEKDRDEFYQKGYIQKEFYEYLCDEGVEFEGLKIWGSPWSLWFPEIHPECAAFTGNERHLENYFDKIPDDIDILITHSPPWGILDINKHKHECGSFALRSNIFRVKPKIHIFGHIHEQGGKTVDLATTKFYNVSIMDADYEPVNNPTNLTL